MTMSNERVGNLIRTLRCEKKMTQRELAELLSVSDKTVSKWERGAGCPDVSILCALSTVFGVNVEVILNGNDDENKTDGGNMKRVKFHVCRECGNIITSTSKADVSCCGRKTVALEPQKCDDAHYLKVEPMEDEYYITFSHEMTKAHYLCFIAYATYDRVLLVRMYPEQGSELRIPQLRGGKFYFYCNRDGLFVQDK